MPIFILMGTNPEYGVWVPPLPTTLAGVLLFYIGILFFGWSRINYSMSDLVIRLKVYEQTSINVFTWRLLNS